jgi:mono/diheme cytochrome c family protein
MLLAAAAALLCSSTALAQDTQRGRLLYENTCTECHGRSVLSRKDRIATNYDEIRTQVERWRKQARAPWTAAEVEDVTAWLNQAVYRFKPPPA